jgi:hypothetical protein
MKRPVEAASDRPVDYAAWKIMPRLDVRTCLILGSTTIGHRMLARLSN